MAKNEVTIGHTSSSQSVKLDVRIDIKDGSISVTAYSVYAPVNPELMKKITDSIHNILERHVGYG
jgi:hypothetical protein